MFKTKETNLYRSSSQSGRSMIEMLGVLFIVGLLSIGGLSLFVRALASMKATKIIEDVQMALRAKSEDIFLEKTGDVAGTPCTAYVPANKDIENCFCQQSDLQVICNVVVKDGDVAEEMVNKLGINSLGTLGQPALTFCLRSNFKVKHNLNGGNENKQTFLWKNGACDGAFTYDD